MTPDDLESMIDDALRAVPPPRAPHGLLARVLAATRELERRPWYTRGWFTWPREWQVAAVGMLLGVMAAGLILLPDVYGPAMDALARAVLGPARRLALVADYIGVAADTGEALWRTLQPLAAAVLAVVLLMCLACAVFGSALGHVIPGRMAER